MVVLITAIVTTVVWASLVAGIVTFMRLSRHQFTLRGMKAVVAVLHVAVAVVGCIGVALGFVFYSIRCGIKDMNASKQPKPKAVLNSKNGEDVVVEKVPVKPITNDNNPVQKKKNPKKTESQKQAAPVQEKEIQI